MWPHSRTHMHVGSDTLMAEERLIIEWFSASRAEMDSCVDRARDEHVLTEAPSRVAVPEPTRLERERVHSRIGGFGEKRRPEHRHERLTRGPPHLSSPFQPFGWQVSTGRCQRQGRAELQLTDIVLEPDGHGISLEVLS